MTTSVKASPLKSPGMRGNLLAVCSTHYVCERSCASIPCLKEGMKDTILLQQLLPLWPLLSCCSQTDDLSIKREHFGAKQFRIKELTFLYFLLVHSRKLISCIQMTCSMVGHTLYSADQDNGCKKGLALVSQGFLAWQVHRLAWVILPSSLTGRLNSSNRRPC